MLELLEGLIYIACILGPLLYMCHCLGPENERNAKLDKEDRILHDLTACQDDVKPISYTGPIISYIGYRNMLVRRK